MYNFFAADTALCTLVGHTATKPSIFANTPDMVAKYPCLVFWEQMTRKVNPYIDELRMTIFTVSIFVKRTDQVTYNGETLYGKLLCDEIAGRAQWLFEPGEQRHPSMSDTVIQVNSASVQERLNIRLEEEEDCWRTDIVLEIMWNYKD